MSELSQHLLLGLRQLAGVCDGARARDEHGFNAYDADFGHSLAEQSDITPNQVDAAFRLCTKYRRQLGEEFYGKLLGLRLMTPPAPAASAAPEGDCDDDDAQDYETNEAIADDPLLTADLNGVAPLTDEQETAIDMILSWLEQSDSREFKLGGYAGTGKTTVIKELIAQVRRKAAVNVCAFTGKAVNVLQRKGVSSQTMHSLMYDVYEDPEGNISFTKKYSLKDDPGLIIIDEASMISVDLYNDLKSFDVPLLFVGDPGQLEPIGDNPNLMAHPDYVLSKIHRQAERSPIIRFATDIRLGRIFKPIPTNPATADTDELVVKPKVVRASEYLAADQIICAKNVTRRNLNNKIRLVMNHKDPLVVEEKLICLRNNRQHGVFNGQLLYVTKIHRETATAWEVDLQDEALRNYTRRLLWREPFVLPQVQENPRIPFNHIYCDYGYVITCHKSQGSEWDQVIVLDEYMPPTVWDMKRWRYTAITRAAKRLTFCI